MAAISTNQAIYTNMVASIAILSESIGTLNKVSVVPQIANLEDIFKRLKTLADQRDSITDYRGGMLEPQLHTVRSAFSTYLMKHAESNPTICKIATQILNGPLLKKDRPGPNTTFDMYVNELREKIQKLLPSKPAIPKLEELNRFVIQLQTFYREIIDSLRSNRGITAEQHANFHRYIIKLSISDDLEVRNQLTKENLGLKLYDDYWSTLALIEYYVGLIQKLGPSGYGPLDELLMDQNGHSYRDPLHTGCARLDPDFFLAPTSVIGELQLPAPAPTIVATPAVPTVAAKPVAPGGPAVPSSPAVPPASVTTRGIVTYEGIGSYGRPIQPKQLLVTISHPTGSFKVEFYSSDTIRYVRNRIANDLGLKFVNQVTIKSGTESLEDDLLLTDVPQPISTSTSISLRVEIDASRQDGRLTMPLGDKVRIYARISSGTVDFQCFMNDTVQRAQCAIADLAGCSWDQIIIHHSGKPFESHRPLADYNVAQQSSIGVIITKAPSSSSSTSAPAKR